LHEPIRKNTRKPTGQNADQIEERVTAMKFIARKPGRDEVQATWEKASLEGTKKDTERRHGPPHIHKAMAELQVRESTPVSFTGMVYLP
jgi:hypothetical protein